MTVCLFCVHEGAINSQNASLAGVEAVRIRSLILSLISLIRIRIPPHLQLI